MVLEVVEEKSNRNVVAVVVVKKENNRNVMVAVEEGKQ